MENGHQTFFADAGLADDQHRLMTTGCDFHLTVESRHGRRRSGKMEIRKDQIRTGSRLGVQYLGFLGHGLEAVQGLGILRFEADGQGQIILIRVFQQQLHRSEGDHRAGGQTRPFHSASIDESAVFAAAVEDHRALIRHFQ